MAVTVVAKRNLVRSRASEILDPLEPSGGWHLEMASDGTTVLVLVGSTCDEARRAERIAVFYRCWVGP